MNNGCRGRSAKSVAATIGVDLSNIRNECAMSAVATSSLDGFSVGILVVTLEIVTEMSGMLPLMITLLYKQVVFLFHFKEWYVCRI